MDLSDYSLDDMRLFAIVVERQSLTAAAAVLGCSKQTVSRRISALEARIGEILLVRTTRSVTPTRRGAAYAQLCREVANLADDSNNRFAASSRRDSLRVTADRVLGDVLLPQVVTRFARTYSDVGTEIILAGEKLDLISDAIDVAIRVGKDAAPDGYVRFELGPAEVRYCASPDYLRRRGTPKRPSDLEHHECIHGEEKAPLWPMRSAGDIELVEVGGRYRLGSFAAMQTAVLAGLGIGLFPAFTCRQFLANGILISVLDEWAGVIGSVSIFRRRAADANAVVNGFVEIARDTYRQWSSH